MDKTKITAAIYPGTFDPLTLGHMDIIMRASGLFNEVIIAAAVSKSKNTMLDINERLFIIRESIKDIDNCKAESFDGLLTDYAASKNAAVIIRGLRTVSDFEYEYQMALTNRHIAGNLETVFLMPSEKYSYISSTLVREIAKLGGDPGDFLPPSASNLLKNKFGK